ncbi:site-specific DNA-methyltransferase [bacterium]|nr:site-specific DNA-methyltransferase [bacterium]
MEINKILQGDVLDKFPEIPDNFVHLIVTSPPYNVGMQYGTDDRKNYSLYLDFMKNVLTHCYRVLIPGGRICINLPSSILQSTKSRMAYLSIDILMIMREIGFLDREFVTWIKMPRGELSGNNVTSWGSWMSASCPYLRDASELVIIMDKEQRKRTDKAGPNDISKEEFLRFTTNCWYIQPNPDRREHPAPFPEELPYRCIKLYSWPGDVVLDPFMGSGTTAVTCVKNNRNYIGIELSEKFCYVAFKNIEQARMPLLKLMEDK